MLACASSPSVGIRSNAPRMSCSSLEVTETSLRGIPASAISTFRLSRSMNASRATRSRSSTGGASRTSASTLRFEALARVEAVGGEVGQPMVVAGDAGVGRQDRVERSGLLDVAVGDGVDGAVRLVAGGWELMRPP